MLADEFGTASNIKSRVNRLSVLSAITSTQQRLKLFTKVPPNGLVIYCGTILTDDNKEKKVNIDFEPFKPINTSLYLCDNKFHTEALQELLESDSKWGFIVMDGNGCLFGTLAGNTREILHKFSVDLPKKHGRGGQSALRFARLRLEKRQNYVRKVAEVSAQMFITNDKCNVEGIVLAGSADFKNDLHASDIFDNRLVAKVLKTNEIVFRVFCLFLNVAPPTLAICQKLIQKIPQKQKKQVLKTVDVSYGGENGFNQAIELSAEALANVKFIQEKKLISTYFEQISQDTGKYCFGIDDTLKALEMGAVETLIVYENLDIMRYTLKNAATEEVSTIHLTKEGEADQTNFVTGEGVELETVEKLQLVEWFAQNYKNFGATLEFITNRSQEGAQFVKGFGGIGGILRYKVDFMEHEWDDEEDDSDDAY